MASEIHVRAGAPLGSDRLRHSCLAPDRGNLSFPEPQYNGFARATVKAEMRSSRILHDDHHTQGRPKDIALYAILATSILYHVQGTGRVGPRCDLMAHFSKT